MENIMKRPVFEYIKYLNTYLTHLIKIEPFKPMWLSTIKGYMLNNYLLSIYSLIGQLL